jgi:hypothetical protein
LHSRVGLGNLAYMAKINKSGTNEEAIGNIAIGMLGPLMQTVLSMGAGVGKIGEGRVVQGLEQIAPKGLRDLSRAFSSDDDMITKSGKYVGEGYSPLDKIYQAIGLTPAKKMRTYETRSAVMSYEKNIANKRSSITDRFYRAFVKGDKAAQAKAMSMARAFNKEHPQTPITSSQLRTGIKTRYKEKAQSRGGSNAKLHETRKALPYTQER